MKIAQNNSGNFQPQSNNGSQNRQAIKRTPSNESSFVNKQGGVGTTNVPVSMIMSGGIGGIGMNA